MAQQQSLRAAAGASALMPTRGADGLRNKMGNLLSRTHPGMLVGSGGATATYFQGDVAEAADARRRHRPVTIAVSWQTRLAIWRKAWPPAEQRQAVVFGHMLRG